MKKIFTKIKDYFTATSCRKVFFMGLCFTLVALILYLATGRLTALWWVSMVAALITTIASMVDSMQNRTAFVRKIKAMQYEHLQAIYDQQQKGAAVAVTPTFTDAERKYLRRKKWGFVVTILFKMAFALVFISMLFV